MPTIFAIGETIYDVIFRQNQPVGARAGGSMLNTAVSLGRCGLKVEMITELGADHVGGIVLDFLNENGVSTSFIRPVDGFKTPVSLAFLDENGNARYSFYKNYPEDRLNIDLPTARRGDVVLFGSFYSLNSAVRTKIIPFIKSSRANGAIVIYDPNIRKNHLEEIKSLMHFVEENIALADIVRGSNEDFESLFGQKDSEKVFKRLNSSGCRHLLYTRGAEGADFLSDAIRLQVPSRNVDVISTIGAGDAFNAGLIFALTKETPSVEWLSDYHSSHWVKMLEYAVIFATEVCGSFDNYISKETGSKFQATHNLA